MIEGLEPRYTILREVGAGSSGRVYLAQDNYLDQELALKVLRSPPRTERRSRQLAEEFALLSRLEHPGVARAFDFGFLDTVPYFTTQFVAGETLARSLEHLGRADLKILLQTALGLSEALAFLHSSQVIHLDVKPSNVILSEAGRPVLVDFGLSQRTGSLAGSELRGSLPYMAPEFFRDGEIDAAADVYALGVTLYQLATGRLPRLGAAGPDGPSRSTDTWDPVLAPPSRFRPDLPAAFDRVVLKALALGRESRFRSASEVHDLLAHAGGQPANTSARSPVLRTLGRDAELDVFDRFIDELARSEQRPAPLLVLTGTTGCGLTHFLEEAKVRAQTRGVSFFLERASPARRPPPGTLLRPLGVNMDSGDRERWSAFLDRLATRRVRGSEMTSPDERPLRWRGELALATAAIRAPVIIAADGLQYFDEISALLLVELLRVVQDGSSAPRLGLLVGCREEGPLAHLVREICEIAIDAAPDHVIAFGPLSPEASRRLYLSLSSKGSAAPSALALYQETGGLPAAIRERAISSSNGTDSAPATDAPNARAARLPARGTLERRVLLSLAALERPVRADELTSLLAEDSTAVEACLDALHASRLVGEESPGVPIRGWIASAAARRSLALVSNRERREIHGALADGLRAENEPRALVESTRHDESAGRRAAFVKYGLEAARYLQDTLQNHTAIDLLERVLEAMPASRKSAHLRVTLSFVELLARVGEIERGIELVRSRLREPATGRTAESLRLLLRFRLATLHMRNGDFQLADSLFAAAFAELQRGATTIAENEQLAFINEYAALKAFLGEHDTAVELSDEGLARAGRRPGDPVVEEIALNLHATRATVALRGFRFDEATREFEVAVGRAEQLGSAVNQAVIQNNLGIAYLACDRYADAIRAFHDAERVCLRLDEGPSLSFIYGNLAVLYSRMARYSSMEEMLDRAIAFVGPESRGAGQGPAGKRQRLFLEHHRGLAEIGRGRHRAAQPCFERALELGRAVGDQLLASFDEVFLGECLLFGAEYDRARAVLEGISESSGAVAPRRQAIARLALLEALVGAPDRVESLIALRDQTPVGAGASVAFLDAGDALFCSWALAIAGKPARARERVAPANEFFSRHGLLAGLSLAVWVRAEIERLDGSAHSALAMRRDRPATETDLVAVIWPLLEARSLLESPDADGTRAAVGDRIAAAGAALLTCPLPEWSARLEALRQSLDPVEAERAASEAPESALRADIAARLRPSQRRAYLTSAYWISWAHLEPATPPARPEAPPAAATRTHVIRLADRETLRRGLVVRSESMRGLSQLLDRLRSTELPVLITGETGVGKELVARIVHVESTRAESTLSIVDCRALPEALLEVELFGARRGAYTGIEEDREGLLAQARGGTVLFDEIGEISVAIQTKLLRLLSGGHFRPLGGSADEHADVRFLFTTSLDLDAAVRQGRFRADLLHRIRVLVLEVPSLAQRSEDIPILARLFLDECAGGRDVDQQFLEALRTREWPGNARELRNFVKRARLEHDAEIPASAAEDSSAAPDSAALFPRELLGSADLPELRRRLERDYIVYHYRRLDGNTRALSELLGVRREQLYRRAAALGLRLRDL